MATKKRTQGTYTISVVASQFGIHPQTLRMYEREGLLKPSRSDGNTRMYTESDVAQLEVILSLTRDLGVNLAGVEIILNMRKKMERMQSQMEEFVSYVNDNMGAAPRGQADGSAMSLVPTPVRVPTRVKTVKKGAKKGD
jgi:MerR family transcriptional regulator/heat shock protein HspR